MGNNLYEASHQWATRPDDQRYESLEAMELACKAYADGAVTSTILSSELAPVARGNDLVLVGSKTGQEAKITHYAFGQLARLVGAPADYLRSLPTEVAEQCLRTGLQLREAKRIQARRPADKLAILFHRNGQLVTRAINTDSYDRVWDWEVIRALRTSRAFEGWRVPPARPVREGQKGTRPATEADVIDWGKHATGLAIKVGDPIAPAGLYASDHDMFAFLVKPGSEIEDGGTILSRGVFVQQSEVGDCAFSFMGFAMDWTCGNHIVWGASNVNRVSVRHVKSERVQRGNTLRNGVIKFRELAGGFESQASKMVLDIKAAKAKVIAQTREEVITEVSRFAKSRSLSALTKATIEAGYEKAEQTPRYGSPRSVWGLVNGLTEYSQCAHTDTRTDLDIQAGRLMEMAF